MIAWDRACLGRRAARMVRGSVRAGVRGAGDPAGVALDDRAEYVPRLVGLPLEISRRGARPAPGSRPIAGSTPPRGGPGTIEATQVLSGEEPGPDRLVDRGTPIPAVVAASEAPGRLVVHRKPEPPARAFAWSMSRPTDRASIGHQGHLGQLGGRRGRRVWRAACGSTPRPPPGRRGRPERRPPGCSARRRRSAERPG